MTFSFSESRGLASTRPLQERNSTIHFLAFGCRLTGPKVMNRYPPGNVPSGHRGIVVPPEAQSGGEASGRKQDASPCHRGFSQRYANSASCLFSCHIPRDTAGQANNRRESSRDRDDRVLDNRG